MINRLREGGKGDTRTKNIKAREGSDVCGHEVSLGYRVRGFHFYFLLTLSW